MRFTKTDNIYKIVRITGTQDNILGISFADQNSAESIPEIVEWNFPKIKNSKINTSKEEILNQVVSGLASVNQSLGTNYKLSKIYFAPQDLPVNKIYSFLIKRLIRHYHNNGKFEEV